jgi:hypothetical protein
MCDFLAEIAISDLLQIMATESQLQQLTTTEWFECPQIMLKSEKNMSPK